MTEPFPNDNDSLLHGLPMGATIFLLVAAFGVIALAFVGVQP